MGSGSPCRTVSGLAADLGCVAGMPTGTPSSARCAACRDSIVSLLSSCWPRATGRPGGKGVSRGSGWPARTAKRSGRSFRLSSVAPVEGGACWSLHGTLGVAAPRPPHSLGQDSLGPRMFRCRILSFACSTGSLLLPLHPACIQRSSVVLGSSCFPPAQHGERTRAERVVPPAACGPTKRSYQYTPVQVRPHA